MSMQMQFGFRTLEMRNVRRWFKRGRIEHKATYEPLRVVYSRAAGREWSTRQIISSRPRVHYGPGKVQWRAGVVMVGTYCPTGWVRSLGSFGGYYWLLSNSNVNWILEWIQGKLWVSGNIVDIKKKNWWNELNDYVGEPIHYEWHDDISMKRHKMVLCPPHLDRLERCIPSPQKYCRRYHMGNILPKNRGLG